MTNNQLVLLQHTIGINEFRREPFRNHFVAGPGHHDEADLVALVESGLMVKKPAPKFCEPGDVVYCCTDSGRRAAIDGLPAEQATTKRSRYSEYLDADCGDSFADFLGVNKPKIAVRGAWKNYEYRMYRSTNADYYDVCGEWSATKKAAKESYKAALNKSRGV